MKLHTGQQISGFGNTGNDIVTFDATVEEIEFDSSADFARAYVRLDTPVVIHGTSRERVIIDCDYNLNVQDSIYTVISNER